MLRGEFIRADGLVIPNNITLFGADFILDHAIRGASTYDFWVALVNAAPDPELQIEDLNEPTIGTNGYARIQIPQNSTGWPVKSTLNNEPYVESDWLTWAASGGDFDKAITRLAIINDETDITGNAVFALSASLAEEITITPETAESDRKFKYRIFLR